MARRPPSRSRWWTPASASRRTSMRWCSRRSSRPAATTCSSRKALAWAFRWRRATSSCTAARSGSKARRARVPRLRSFCPNGCWRWHEQDPDRRRQRQEHEAGARHPAAQGLRDAGGGDRRRRRAPGHRADSRPDPDGHPAARHRRHPGAPADPRATGAERHTGAGRHGIGDARGPAQDRQLRLRRLHQQTAQRQTLHGGRRAFPRVRPEIAMSAKILVVDDNPLNVKMLADILAFNHYQVVKASGGREALAQLQAEKPDLVLLDVMMPDLDGYSVCTAIRANPDTAMLPVVMVTALDPREERVKGVEAGADDFLSKPVNQQELLARVRSLLRIKAYHDQVQAQARELQEWSRTLERRVEEGVQQVERLSRMKRFLSPQIAELVVGAGASLKTHRSEITVVFLDFRGFTALTETADPEEVLQVLREYQAEMGQFIMAYQGTLGGFSGDAIMIFFNDPLPLDNPAEQAVRMCIDMQERFAQLRQAWSNVGHELGLGIGIAQGFATLGVIGFEGRQDYGAIGTVCNLASRLCGEAQAGQILVAQRVLGAIGNLVLAQPAGDLRLKDFRKPVPAFNVTGLAQGRSVQTSGATAQ